MTELAYRAGTTPTAVHGNDAVMVLADEARAREVWRVVSSPGWTDTQVLDVLTIGGLSSTPDFCAVVIRRRRATILVRGNCSATVTVGEQTERIDGTSVSTWVERSIRWTDDAVVELAAGDPVGEVDLPVASGVVLAGLVRVGVHPDPPVEEALSGLSAPELVEDVAESALPVDPVQEVPPAEEPAEEADADAVGEPRAVESPPTDPNATLADVDESSFDAMFGATVPGRRLEDAAVRELGPDQAPDAAPPTSSLSPVATPDPTLGDHDGHTMSSAERARLRSQAPPAAVPAAAIVPQISVTLEFSTGRRVVLDRPAVIGRSPRAHGSSSLEMPQLVVIDNPYVSGTHLVASVDDGVVVVTDLSTNGTLVKLPGEEPRRLDKGRETVVIDGSVLNLSDDVAVTVTVTGGM